MRFFIDLPAPFVDKLRDQARIAHRPPRYHAEWLVIQALQDQETGDTDWGREDLRDTDSPEAAVTV